MAQEISLVESIDDIPSNIKKPVFVTNQTTFSFMEIEPIIDSIIQLYPDTLISEEICNATRMRQTAIIEHNLGVDLCYTVGDPRSYNTRHLVLISQNYTKTRTLMIETKADIDVNDLINVKTVSVSSGASTPAYLTNEVIEFLKNYN